MNNRVLLEILQDKRVQKLINIAMKEAECCKSDTSIIDRVRQKLSVKKEGPSNWIQTKINL